MSEETPEELHRIIFQLRAELDCAQDEADEFRQLLKDVLDIEAELDAIGGGPHWKRRREEIYARAWEPFLP